MPLVPVNVDGQIQMVVLPSGSSARDQQMAAEENARRIEVHHRRQYAQGEQYDALNADHHATACATSPRLPEHERIHAYSVQIEDSIEFLVAQLCEAFTFEAADAGVQSTIERALRRSDQFSGENDDDEIVMDLVLRDAMIAQDAPCHIRWDPVDGTAYVEVWESEHVQFDWEKRGLLSKVIRTEVVWVKGDDNTDRQVLERVEYDLALNEFGEIECRAVTWWDDEITPRSTEWQGLPFIPWVLLKVRRKKLRGVRGESMITKQVMEHADRYNANEQNSYLISRYNSHSNLAVVGDLANLQIGTNTAVAKDVADVLTFPGGTAVTALELPTDAQMIEHQRSVLAEALYNCFGLTRVEPDTIEGLGSVSGYALEILNRKTEGTFRGIRREFSSSVKAMFRMILDVTAYRSVAKVVALIDGEQVSFDDLDENMDLTLDGFQVVAGAFWEVDPDTIYPNTQIEITMGSGYIVSDVLVRDDYTADLISRREGLRQRGYDDTDIDEIEKEIAEEKSSESTEGTTPFVQPPPVGTVAGATVG